MSNASQMLHKHGTQCWKTKQTAASNKNFKLWNDVTWKFGMTWRDTIRNLDKNQRLNHIRIIFLWWCAKSFRNRPQLPTTAMTRLNGIKDNCREQQRRYRWYKYGNVCYAKSHCKFDGIRLKTASEMGTQSNL